MFSDSVDSLPLDFMPQMGDRIDLNSAGIDRAAVLSLRIPEPVRWQSYLALLALEGFATWLDDHTMPVHLDRSHARLVQPTRFDVPAAITHVALNQLQVCLIAVSADDEVIELPISVVDDPSQIAHLYIAMAVDDEQGQTEVQSFIRYDQIVYQQQHVGLLPTQERTYLLPKEIFDWDLHHLLLFAAALKSTAITLPTSANATLPAIQQILLQPVANAATWTVQQLSELPQGLHQLTRDLLLSWAAPELPLANAMRSSHAAVTQPGANLLTILQDLQSQGYALPEELRAAYQDLVVGDRTIRLSIVIWQLSSTLSTETNNETDNDPEREWSLLASIEIVQGTALTDGIRLFIQDQNSVVIEKVLLPGVAYETAQVIGTLSQLFKIT